MKLYVCSVTVIVWLYECRHKVMGSIRVHLIPKITEEPLCVSEDQRAKLNDWRGLGILTKDWRHWLMNEGIMPSPSGEGVCSFSLCQLVRRPYVVWPITREGIYLWSSNFVHMLFVAEVDIYSVWDPQVKGQGHSDINPRPLPPRTGLNIFQEYMVIVLKEGHWLLRSWHEIDSFSPKRVQCLFSSWSVIHVCQCMTFKSLFWS